MSFIKTGKKLCGGCGFALPESRTCTTRACWNDYSKSPADFAHLEDERVEEGVADLRDKAAQLARKWLETASDLEHDPEDDSRPKRGAACALMVYKACAAELEAAFNLDSK